MTLSKDEIQRYSRHLIVPEVGMEGQLKLKGAKVLLVGTGGLGAPLGLYLAAAGIGRIGLVDFDVVDFSNLQRQVIHFTQDVGRNKIDSAAEKMTALNPNVEIVKHEVALSSENAMEILKDYDLVVDGTDNFPTRYLVNDACVLLGKPNVYGSIFRFEGQATVFAYEAAPAIAASIRASTTRLSPKLRRGWRPGILPAPSDLSGHRSRQADSRNRRTTGRTPAAVRRARNALPRTQTAQESRVPYLRRAPDNHQADRLPSVLRRAATSDARNPEAGGPGDRKRNRSNRSQREARPWR